MSLLNLYLTFSLLVCFFISAYSLQSKARGSKFFAVTCFLGTFWTLAELIKRTWTEYEVQFIAENFRFLFVIFLPPSLFIFALQYCKKKVTSFHVALILLIPIISTLMLITNEAHLLFFKGKSFDPSGVLKFEFNHYYWWIHLPYSYGIIASTLSVIADSMKNSPERDRKSLLTLFLSIMIPFLFDAYRLFSGNSIPSVISFPIFSSVIAFAVLRYDFLRSNPVAYEKVFSSMQDGVVIVNKENIVLDVNPVVTKILGKSRSDLIGNSLEEGFSAWKEIVEKYKDYSSLQDELSVNYKGEKRYFLVTIIPIEDDSEGRVFILRDITDQKNYEFFLKNLAFRDALTQVANRRRFQEELEFCLLESKRKKERLAVVYFDLNDFKKVNDEFGHETGDELLKLVAIRVNSVLRERDFLARIGGDEFAILINDCDHNGAQTVVERIKSVINEPFIINDQVFKLGISIGVAIYPEDGETQKELTRTADKRLIASKKLKRVRKEGSA